MTFKKRLREPLNWLWDEPFNRLLIGNPNHRTVAINAVEQQILDLVKECMMSEDEIIQIIDKTQNIPVYCALDGMMAMDYMKKEIAKAISKEMLKRLEEE